MEAWKRKQHNRAIVDHRKELANLNIGKSTTLIESLMFQNGSSPQSIVGDETHKYVEQVAKGLEITPQHGDTRDSCAQFDRFVRDYRPKFIESEATIFSRKYGYAGSLDLIVEIDGVRYILDVKTGRTVWSEVALQIAAYDNGDFIGLPTGVEVPISPTKRGLCLHVRPDRYELLPVKCGPDVFRTFLSCLDVYDWARRDSGYVIGDPLSHDD